MHKKIGSKADFLSQKAFLSLYVDIARKLSQLFTPALLKEMQIQSASFNLEGESARKRYLSFLRKFGTNGPWINSFFRTHPEMKRLKEKTCKFWIDQIAEWLSRLENDKLELEKTFNQGLPLGKIVDCSQTFSDTHSKGRSVCLLQFTSGKQLFYKPKYLHLAQAFGTLLYELNQTGLHPPLTPLHYFTQERLWMGGENRTNPMPNSSRSR